MAARKKSIDFEQSLQELEKLVNTLEQGDLSLEEALKSFEQGVALAGQCQTALQQAEQRVELLTATQGQGDDSSGGEQLQAFRIES